MSHLCCEAGQGIDKGYGEIILQVIAVALKALVGQRSVQPTPKTIRITVQKLKKAVTTERLKGVVRCSSTFDQQAWTASQHASASY